MADLYVSTSGSDANNGTRNSPFKTIQKASRAAKGETTVHVAPGTYEGGFTTAADDVTYVSDARWGAKIVPGSGNGQRQAWKNLGDDVVIDGFEVDGSNPRGGTPWLTGIYSGGSDSEIRNNKVHDLLRTSSAMSAASGGQGGAGIVGDGWSGGTDITVAGNTVYNIGPSGVSSDLVHGIYMTTTGTVRDNTVHDVVGDGITSWHDATGLTVTGNTVYEVNGAGIMIGAGDHVRGSGPNDDTKVSNNTVTDSRKGIEEYGDTGSNNTFTGNTVRDNATDWALQDGRKAAMGLDPSLDWTSQLQGDDGTAAAMPELEPATPQPVEGAVAVLPDPVGAPYGTADVMAGLLDQTLGRSAEAALFYGG